MAKVVGSNPIIRLNKILGFSGVVALLSRSFRPGGSFNSSCTAPRRNTLLYSFVPSVAAALLHAEMRGDDSSRPPAPLEAERAMEWLNLSGDLTREHAVEQLLAPSTSAEADSERCAWRTRRHPGLRPPGAQVEQNVPERPANLHDPVARVRLGTAEVNGLNAHPHREGDGPRRSR
jgi:hypothetical protein